jgi:heat shock protein HslJ
MRLSILLLAVALLSSTFGPLASTALALPHSKALNLDSSLAGTQWRLESIGGAAINGVSKITLKFGADGRAGGSGGCNSYSGAYREQGERLSFSRIISTKRACLEQTANQHEQRYLAALEAAARFKLSGDRLTIFYGAGQGGLNFVNDSPAKTGQEKYENLSSPVDLLASFYDAVSNKDYARAYGYWETPPGTLQDFQKGYRDTSSVQLIVRPPTHLDGAAGSLYAEVPTVIVAGQRNGSERVFAGCYVMRKSNVGESDSTSHGVWRIYKASLSPVAANTAIRPKLFAQLCTN